MGYNDYPNLQEGGSCWYGPPATCDASYSEYWRFCVCDSETIQCADLDKKPCRKEHDDECMWNTVLKQCQSKDWAPVCSDFTSNKKHCKRLGKKGYNCKWSSGECIAKAEAASKGLIYEPNSKKCLTFATVQDYL